MEKPARPGAVSELLDEAADLRQAELALLRAELSAMESMAARGLGLLVVAASFALATIGLLAWTMVAALVAAGWEPAPAALIAAAATASFAVLAARLGRTAIREAAAGPRRTVRALSRDLALAQDALR